MINSIVDYNIMISSSFFNKIGLNGFKIDKKALQTVRSDFEEELVAIERRLQDQVRELMGDTPINLNSPEQVSQVIYSRILCDKKKWAVAFDTVDGKEEFKYSSGSY